MKNPSTRRSPTPARGARVILGQHEIAALIVHLEKAAVAAARAGIPAAAAACDWRVAVLRRAAR